MAVLLLATTLVRAVDVQSLPSAVDHHYNHLRSLQCEFTETYTGLGMDRSESGTLWLKKPGKMRGEETPRSALVTCRAKTREKRAPTR